jgi:Peptidase A4 family
MRHTKPKGDGLVTSFEAGEFLDFIAKGSRQERHEHGRLLPYFTRAKRAGVRYVAPTFRRTNLPSADLISSENRSWSGAQLQLIGELTGTAPGRITQVQSNWTVPGLGGPEGRFASTSNYLPTYVWVGIGSSQPRSAGGYVWQAGAWQVLNPSKGSPRSFVYPGGTADPADYPGALSAWFQVPYNPPGSVADDAGTMGPIAMPEFPLDPGDLLEVIIFQINELVDPLSHQGAAGFVFVNWTQLAQMQFSYECGVPLDATEADWVVEQPASTAAQYPLPNYGAVYFDGAQCTYQGATIGRYIPSPQYLYPGAAALGVATVLGNYLNNTTRLSGSSGPSVVSVSTPAALTAQGDLVRVQYGAELQFVRPVGRKLG